jgi:hypothetical protein
MIGNGGGFTAGATGGSADAVLVSHTHTATVTDPGHLHTQQGYTYTSAAPGGFTPLASSYTPPSNMGSTTSATTGITVANSTEGVSPTNANLQPYVVIYMWNRTA